MKRSGNTSQPCRAYRWGGGDKNGWMEGCRRDDGECLNGST